MKEIYFIRHAKTEKIATAENLKIFCDEFGDKFLSGRGYDKANFGSDFVRNLNEIGREQAKNLAQKFARNGILPSVIITSSALRTMQTAQILANNLNYEEEIFISLCSNNDDHGLSALEAVDGLHNCCLCLVIKRTCRLVEYQNLRIMIKSSCDTDPLSLSAGEPYASVTDLGIKPLGKALYEVG